MEEHNPLTSATESAAALSASALRELQQRAHAALTASREKSARLEADITRHLDELSDALQDQLAQDANGSAEAEALQANIARLAQELESERAARQAEQNAAEASQAEITRLTQDVETVRAAWQVERAGAEAFQAELARLTEELEAARAALEVDRTGSETLQAEIDRVSRESEQARDAWQADREALEAERDASVRKASELEARMEASQDEWRNQLIDFEGRLREQHASWNDQRSEWATARTDLERQRDELQHKFDLALQDVQRLRARTAELEQDLARRPEAKQADSAELVALRAERDALATRVAELEQRPATQIDPNVEQQLADLQRRFELAVEDVRELKTKNAKLESQLASAGNRSQSQPDTGGSDWESQKRRLLAALEGGDDHEDPLPKQDRITIEGTIEITDAVVAEKDRQIVELQTQLAAANDSAVSDCERNRKVNELVDADEVIAEHRKRIRELEREMEEKLRTAELELSVERAKMARQKVELDDLQSELESQRQAFEAAGGPVGPGQPRRRWLSKLGLTGEE